MIERLLFARLPAWALLVSAVAALLLGGAWAWSAATQNVFPGPQMREIRAFIRGTPGDERPLWTRFLSARGYVARAFPAPFAHSVLPPDAFVPVRAADGATSLPAIGGMRIANPGGETRYFVVFGSFAFDDAGTAIGTIAIDSTGTIHRAWPAVLDESGFPGPHIGLAVSPEGIVATNARSILHAKSWCGEDLWQAPFAPVEDGPRPDFNRFDSTDWHHDIAYEDGRFWTYLGPEIAAVDAATGAIVERLHMVELMHWSWRQGLALMDGGTGIFDPERLTPRSAVRLLPADPFHPNKVVPLGAAQAPLYPGFEAGDLLINLRNQDLVAVVRPSEERFVWWRLGLTSRAHDASFVEGHVEVFNNASFSQPAAPTIRRLDLDDPQGFTDILQLDRFGMRMRQKGNFERRGAQVLTVDDEAGRMLAVTLDGTLEVVFENGHDNGEDVVALQLRNATEIDADTFARLEAGCR